MRRGSREHGSSEEREEGRTGLHFIRQRLEVSAYVGMFELESALGIRQEVSRIRVQKARDFVFRLSDRLIATKSWLAGGCTILPPSMCSLQQHVQQRESV